MKRVVIFGAVGVGMATVAQAQQPVQLSVTVDGQIRRWIEYRPGSLVPDVPVPIVIMLHPGASTPENSFATSGWNQVADREGILIVYPAATPGEDIASGIWNAWDFEDAPLPSGAPPGIAVRDDVGTLSAMINQISTRNEYQADPDRVFMTGFSSGAQMTNTYLGAGGSAVVAAAPVSGGWAEQYGVPVQFVQPASPVPVWIWAGEREADLSPAGVSRAIHDAAQLAFWTDFNGTGSNIDDTLTLTGSYTRRTIGPGGVIIEREIEQTFITDFFRGGDQPVRFTTVLDASHAYHPGAADLIWYTFFSTYGSGRCIADVAPPEGAVDFFDTLAFLAGYDTGAIDADLDKDGELTLVDVIIHMIHAESCCP